MIKSLLLHYHHLFVAVGIVTCRPTHSIALFPGLPSFFVLLFAFSIIHLSALPLLGMRLHFDTVTFIYHLILTLLTPHLMGQDKTVHPKCASIFVAPAH